MKTKDSASPETPVAEELSSGKGQAEREEQWKKDAREFADKANLCTHSGIYSSALPLFKELHELRYDKMMSSDFLAFMAGTFADWPCCHDEGGHKGTPPMMWPELIACIVKRARNDAITGNHVTHDQIEEWKCKCGHAPQEHYRSKGRCTIIMCQCNRLRRKQEKASRRLPVNPNQI